MDNSQKSNTQAPPSYNPHSVMQQPGQGDYPLLNDPLTMSQLSADEPQKYYGPKMTIRRIAGAFALLVMLVSIPLIVNSIQRPTYTRLRATDPTPTISPTPTPTPTVSAGFTSEFR